MPLKQKALLLKEKQGDFILGENDIPTPGPGDVLVKIRATSLNPADWKIQRYGVLVQEYPAVLGTDVAGDVEEVGEGVAEFKKGDRVFAQGLFTNTRASYQQYTLVRSSLLARIPPNYSYDQISALPVVLTAAYLGFYNSVPYGLGITPPSSEEARRKYAGVPIVVLGGATSVGQLVIQFAKYSSFSPIITTASTKHTDNLKSLGATHVFDRNLSTKDLANAIKKVTDKPIQYVYDSVSSATTQQAGFDILAPGGHLEIMAPLAVDVPQNKVLCASIGFPNTPENKDLVEELYRDKIFDWLEQGIIKPNKIEVLPGGLQSVSDGLKRLESDQVSGLKLVVRPQETP